RRQLPLFDRRQRGGRTLHARPLRPADARLHDRARRRARGRGRPAARRARMTQGAPRIAHLERGTGAPVVFLHGVGGGADCWAPQLDHVGARYRAIAWDMPGYGGSAPLPETTFCALANALARLLDTLDVAAAHLVGHSMGGMVALEMMDRH